MAVTHVIVATPAGLVKYSNTDVDGVTAVSAASGTLHSMVIDNTANGAVTYIKAWDLGTGSITFGTTSPDYVWKIPASVKRTIVFADGMPFGTAFSIAASTTAALAGVTAPTSSVAVDIVYA